MIAEAAVDKENAASSAAISEVFRVEGPLFIIKVRDLRRVFTMAHELIKPQSWSALLCERDRAFSGVLALGDLPDNRDPVPSSSPRSLLGSLP